MIEIGQRGPRFPFESMNRFADLSGKLTRLGSVPAPSPLSEKGSIEYGKILGDYFVEGIKEKKRKKREEEFEVSNSRAN